MEIFNCVHPLTACVYPIFHKTIQASLFEAENQLVLKSSPSYFSAIFGTTLVLVVLGLAGMIGIELSRWGASLQEQLAIEMVLTDSIAASSPEALISEVKALKEIHSLKFVSKTEAARMLQKDLGEDFMDILGYNPLYSSLLVYLKAGYTDEASISKIKNLLSSFPGVVEVGVQDQLVKVLNERLQLAGLILAVLGGILLIFSVSVIFTTTRLALSSNRFVVKSMQLFGATSWFIMRPFLFRALLSGLLSGLISACVLAAIYFYALQELGNLGMRPDFFNFALLCAGLLLLGMLLVSLSTLLALNRYLNKRSEELY